MAGAERWREGGDAASGEPMPPAVHQLLEAARSEEAWAEADRRRLWRQVLSRHERRQGARPLVVGLALATALVALVSTQGLGPPAMAPAPVVPVAPAVTASPGVQERTLEGGDRLGVAQGTRYTVEERALAAGGLERRVRLSRGELQAEVVHRKPGERFVVETPHLTVTVVGTRFTVDVQHGRSHVRVEQGRVRVDMAGTTVMLGAGEEVGSDDLRLLAPPAPPEPDVRAPPAPGARPRALSSCADSTSVRCLEQRARGNGLAAQTALQDLAQQAQAAGRTEEAIRFWQQSLARFPQGVLAPEVHLSLFDAWLALGRTAEARGIADAFLARFPEDPRAQELARARARLDAASPDATSAPGP